MQIDAPSARPTTPVSWVMMILALASLTFLALYIPPDRRAGIRMLHDFKVELPALTQWMIAIPDLAFPAAAVAIGAVVIVVQWLGRGSIASASFHMLVVVACAAFFVAYREALFEPVIVLIRQISGPSKY